MKYVHQFSVYRLVVLYSFSEGTPNNLIIINTNHYITLSTVVLGCQALPYGQQPLVMRCGRPPALRNVLISLHAHRIADIRSSRSGMVHCPVSSLSATNTILLLLDLRKPCSMNSSNWSTSVLNSE